MKALAALLGAFALLIPMLAAAQPAPVTIFNLIPEMNKPGFTLGLYSDEGLVLQGTAENATIGFGSPSAVVLSPVSPISVAAWRAQRWTEQDWNHIINGQTLSLGLPQLGIPGTTVATPGNNSVVISAAPPGGPCTGTNGSIVTLTPTSFTQESNTDPWFCTWFNGNAPTGWYSANNFLVAWPLLGLAVHFAPTYLGSYSTLVFDMTAQLPVINAETAPVGGTAPENASNTYNQFINAMRLYLGLELHWHPHFCDTPAGAINTTCNFYLDKPLGNLLYFFDNRYGNRNWPLAFAANNNAWVPGPQYWPGPAYSGDPRETTSFSQLFLSRNSPQLLIPGQPAANPFLIANNTVTIDIDLLPYLRSVILAALAASANTYNNQPPLVVTNYVPPRLVINGATETDQQYFNDYYIEDWSLNMENSDRGDYSVQLTAYSLVGTPNVNYPGLWIGVTPRPAP